MATNELIMSSMASNSTSHQHPEAKKTRTVIVIDKNYFCLCKRYIMEGAPDENYSNLLKIPPEKVKIFKHKMQIFEKNLRARRKKVVDLEPQRRGPKRKPKPPPQPPEKAPRIASTREARVELHKKSRQVRDLILDNKNNKQIAEIVGVDTNFVARMRLRMFRQKLQLIEKGELQVNEDELEFKYLSHEMKAKRIAKLLEEGHRAMEIGRILKIEERTVNRWRERIREMEKDPQKYQEIIAKSRLQNNKIKHQDYLPRYRQSIDKSQVEDTKRLLECGVNYKDISTTLKIPMSNVMKIKKAILTNKIHEIVDDTAEKIKENVLMRKSGLIESDEEEIKPKPRRKRRKVETRSGKIELRKKRAKVQVKSEESESENYSDVSDNDWKPQDSSDGSNEDFDDENFEEIYEPQSGSNYESNIDIKKEKFDEIYEKNIKIEKVESGADQNFEDPLIEPEIVITDITESSIEPPPFESPKRSHKKPKTHQKLPVKKFYPRDTLGNKPLNDRDAILAKKLLDNGIRRVDIAVMLETTEKAVSKLLDRAQGLDVENASDEINESVENFIRNKEKYKGVQKHYGEKGIVIREEKKKKEKSKRREKFEVEKVKDEEISDEESCEDQMEVKRQTAMKLLLVNVKVADIVKMLNVPEETVKRWKAGKDDRQKDKSTSKSRKSSSRNKNSLDVKSEPEDDEED